jgi:hypothetical protein
MVFFDNRMRCSSGLTVSRCQAPLAGVHFAGKTGVVHRRSVVGEWGVGAPEKMSRAGRSRHAPEGGRFQSVTSTGAQSLIHQNRD